MYRGHNEVRGEVSNMPIVLIITIPVLYELIACAYTMSLGNTIICSGACLPEIGRILFPAQWPGL